MYPQQQQPMYPAQPQMHQQMPTPQKSGGAGKWLALGCGALVLIGLVGGALAYFLIFAKPAPHLARYVPKNTSVYVEIPSFQHSLVSAASMKPLDASRVDDKLMTQEISVAFQRAFTLSNDDAHALASSFDASAVAVRDTNHDAQGAFIVTFSKTAPVEALLKTPRFSDASPFVGGGTKYTLDKRPFTEVSPNASIVEKSLSDMTTRSHHGAGDDLVWFPKKKMLVFGDDAMVTDIASTIDGAADSLEKNDAYVAAKKTFESGSDVAFFFDTHDFDDTKDPSSKKLLDGYLQKRDPMTGAIKLVKAGIMMDFHATFNGTSVPPDDIAAKPSMTIHHKLPSDTVAYMAVSTKTKMTGAQLHALFLKNVAASDPSTAKEVGDGITTMETSLGIKLDDFLDMVGDETALAFTLDPAFKLDTSDGLADELGKFGVIYVLGVKDDAKAKAILAKIHALIDTPDTAKVAKLSTTPDGFEIDPQTVATFPVPNLTVKYDGKRIVVVLGSPTETARAVNAITAGKDTLESNSAHELALSSMPKDANFYMWLDTGRITSLMMDGASHVSRHAVGSSLPIDAVRLTGNDRVTTALAIRSSTKDGSWSLDFDSLNLPATSLFSVAEDLNLSSAMPRGPIFAPPPK